MSTAKDSNLEKIECDVEEEHKYVEVSHNFEKDDLSSAIEGNIVIDTGGYFYIQSSKSVVKVEPLPKVSGTPSKKMPAEKTNKRTTGNMTQYVADKNADKYYIVKNSSSC